MNNRVKHDVKRGALVNALGFIGRAAGPVFLILVARLYGPASLGVYLTAAALVETALAFLVAGFKDGALIFVARHADDVQEHPLLYQALVNAIGWSLLFAALIIAVTFTVGKDLIPTLYESYGDQLLPLLKWMILILPLVTFERVVLGATQGLKIMKYEAFVGGGIRPLLLVGTAALFWLWSPDLRGLAAAYVTTQSLVFLVATAIYTREFAWPPLWNALRELRVNRDLIAFAFPQNINATFDRFITNLDVIMLGMFGLSATAIGFYGAGALIVREIRQIKLIFSTAFAPHIVRLFRLRDLDQLSHLFATTSRWITIPLIPTVIGIVILKNDLLQLVHPDFANESALFMLYLLVIPYLQGSFGLAGNVVVMSGNSRLNLMNSTFAGASNILLNLLLIPPFSLVGAAAASGLTAIMKTVLELTELRFFLRVRLRFSEMFKPHLAGLITSLVLFFGHGIGAVPLTSLSHRIGVTAGMLLLYGITLASLMGRLPWTRDPDTD